MPDTTSSTTIAIDEPTFQTLLRRIRPLVGYDEVRAMIHEIRPVVRLSDGLHHVDTDSINVHRSNLYRGPFHHPVLGLREHSRMLTLHRFTLGGQFEPYATEVLAMLPIDLPDEVIAFEVLSPFEANDIESQRIALNHGYHVAWTILYELDA